MSRFKPIRHTLEHWVLVAFSAAMQVLPRSAALAVGAAVGQLGWWSRIRRPIVMRNLAQALPTLSQAELRRVGARATRNFARTLVEFLRFIQRDRVRVEELITFEGLDDLRQALADGHGAVVVTGHLGAWALYVSALGAQGIPMALLVARQHNPKADRLILDLPDETVELISKGPGSPRGLLKALKAGKAVVLVADHNAGPRGIFVPFFGKVTSTLPLPGALVARHGQPLFLMMGHRIEGGRHRVSLRRLEVPALDGETQGRAEQEGVLRRKIATLLNEAIGHAASQRPEQYYWFHRRFRDYPEARQVEALLKRQSSSQNGVGE